jgi:hypothetical protein
MPPPPPPPAVPALAIDPTKRVIGFSSMVTDVELADDAECRDILDDAKTECEKHGAVDGIVLLRAGQHGPPDLVSDKIIFVRFATADAAAGAARVLHGKKFDGRIVTASFFSDGQFEALSALPHHSC